MSRPFALPSAPTLIDDKPVDSPRDPLPISSAPSLPLSAPSPRPRLSQRKKWALLALFSLGMCIDTWGTAGFIIFTSPISYDLSVRFEQSTWVLNSYAAPFAAFLLLWGWISDIYSAKPVFTYGFISLGVLSLINSFAPKKISFFVLRGLSGAVGAALIPASYRLIVLVFEPHELGRAFTIYGMAGSLANATGFIISGVMQTMGTSGQMAPWRWFLRLLAAIILPFAIGSFFWIPHPPPRTTPNLSEWKHLDLIGSFSMLTAILLLILGITLGASNGFRTPQFLVPFLLSFVLLGVFFYWEHRIPAAHAILPPAVWSIPNFTLYNMLALINHCWFAAAFLSLTETFVRVNGDSYLIASAKVIPICASAILGTIVIVLHPGMVARPRWALTFGLGGGVVGYILFALSHGGAGWRYWAFIFPGSVVGAAGMIVAFTATNVGIMIAVPPDMAGVAGGLFQVALQVGMVVGLSMQAALLTVQPGSLANPVNLRAAYLFMAGWGVAWMMVFLVFYKPGKRVEEYTRADLSRDAVRDAGRTQVVRGETRILCGGT